MFSAVASLVLVVLIAGTAVVHVEFLPALFMLGQPLLSYAMSLGHGGAVGRTEWGAAHLVLLGCVVACVLPRFLRKWRGPRVKLNTDLLWVAIVVDGVLLVLSLQHSPDPAYGLQKLWFHLVFEVGGFALVLTTIRTMEQARRFLWYCVLLGSVTVALLLSYMWEVHGTLVLFFRLPQQETVFHGFRLPSGLSLGYRQAVVGAIAMNLLYLSQRRHIARRAFLLTLISVSIYLVIASATRGAAILLLFVGCVTPLLLRREGWRRMTAVFLFLCTTYLLLQFSHPQVQARVRGTTLGERTVNWRFGLELASDHVLTGVGLGGYGHYEIGPGHRTYPHNILIEYLVEAGVFGLLAIVFLVVAAIKRAFRMIRTPSGEAQARVSAVSFATIFVIGFGHALVSGFIGSQEMLWIAMGLLFSQTLEADGIPALSGNRKLYRRWRAMRASPHAVGSGFAANAADPCVLALCTPARRGSMGFHRTSMCPPA